MKFLERKLKDAVTHFWETREIQANKQVAGAGSKDTGNRSAATGGKQMNGFTSAIREILVESGLDDVCIYSKRKTELPGYFRPEKRWDLVVVVESKLVACIEFKSQIGPSFGNNYNNRGEEAIGIATDFWTAFREGTFSLAERPWLGYMMLLEESRESTSPVSVREPHFPVSEVFRDASYAKRYEILLTRLVRERLYDSACFLMSNARQGKRGIFREPSPELSFQQFVASLTGHALAQTKFSS